MGPSVSTFLQSDLAEKDRLLRYGFRPEGRTKATLFETFYGKLETAPMIKECPLNVELPTGSDR